MKRGETIIIQEIHNGVMIEPYNQNSNCVTANTEKIAFQDAKSFAEWINAHFLIYKIPEWDEKNV